MTLDELACVEPGKKRQQTLLHTLYGLFHYIFRMSSLFYEGWR